jgi:hypothetical protein
MGLYLKVKDGVTALSSLTLYLTPFGDTPNDANDRITLQLDTGFGNLPHVEKAYATPKPTGVWSLRASKAENGNISFANTIEDIGILCSFEVR